MPSSPANNTSRCLPLIRAGLLVAVALLLSGCPVPQKPGSGIQVKHKEVKTGKKFYLYLPKGYHPNKRWPIVVTIHGLVPFDTADRQIREWQATADKYGLIVIAPELWNSGVFMEFRLWRISRSVQKDIDAVLNMIDYVAENTAADPKQVLITGWSSAGFLVHYLANRHPDRFAALCARSCSFNRSILDEDAGRKMAKNNFPIMVFSSTEDFLDSRIGSAFAIKWYTRLGFNVETMTIPQKTILPGIGLGHDRHPGIAAEFFLRSTNIKGVLRIVGSAEQGDAPMPVNFSVEVPHHIESDGLKYSWTLDGEHISNSPEVYTTISTPGLHTVQVMVTDSNGKTLITSREIIVRSPGS